jgi:hypothetical protein
MARGPPDLDDTFGDSLQGRKELSQGMVAFCTDSCGEKATFSGGLRGGGYFLQAGQSFLHDICMTGCRQPGAERAQWRVCSRLAARPGKYRWLLAVPIFSLPLRSIRSILSCGHSLVVTFFSPPPPEQKQLSLVPGGLGPPDCSPCSSVSGKKRSCHSWASVD